MTDLIFVCTMSGNMSNIDKIKELLEKGANINYQDYYGHTALISVSLNGYTKIVKFLLNYEKQKVDIYRRDALTNNARDIAYKNGYTEIVDLLNDYENFRKNIKEFIPSYNILLFILIGNNRTYKYMFIPTLPNEIILLIKECGIIVCGRELFR